MRILLLGVVWLICFAPVLAQTSFEATWSQSAHAQAGLSCPDCHEPLKNINESKLVCYQCHDDKKKFFEMTPHGRKGLQCAACHDPHGSRNDKLFRQTAKGEDFCQTCHAEQQPHHFIADKRTLEMKKLRCTNCHQPHSKQKHYLKYKKEELCVHCHKEVY